MGPLPFSTGRGYLGSEQKAQKLEGKVSRFFKRENGRSGSSNEIVSALIFCRHARMTLEMSEIGLIPTLPKNSSNRDDSNYLISFTKLAKMKS